MAAACSRETAAPPATATKPAPPAAVTPTTSTAPAAAPDAPKSGSYDEAMLWFRSAPAFHFVLDEGAVHAEGDLTRRTVGNEVVQLRANGQEWRATTGPRGVVWELRKGNTWTAAPAPDYGNRVYQRVTLAFDPQKKEGSAQFVAAEGNANHYRFTNANTAEVHDVWVNIAGNHVERMKIGDSFEMRITLGK